MKYITLFGASFVFIVLRHLSSQRHKQAEMERDAFRAAAKRADLEQERTR